MRRRGYWKGFTGRRPPRGSQVLSLVVGPCIVSESPETRWAVWCPFFLSLDLALLTFFKGDSKYQNVAIWNCWSQIFHQTEVISAVMRHCWPRGLGLAQKGKGVPSVLSLVSRVSQPSSWSITNSFCIHPYSCDWASLSFHLIWKKVRIVSQVLRGANIVWEYGLCRAMCWQQRPRDNQRSKWRSLRVVDTETPGRWSEVICWSAVSMGFYALAYSSSPWSEKMRKLRSYQVNGAVQWVFPRFFRWPIELQWRTVTIGQDARDIWNMMKYMLYHSTLFVVDHAHKTIDQSYAACV